MKQRDFEGQIRALQQKAQDVATQKATAEAAIKQVKRELEEVEKTRADKEIYSMVGRMYIKSDREELKSRLTKNLETLDMQLKFLDKKQSQIWSQSQQLQERMRGGKKAANYST